MDMREDLRFICSTVDASLLYAEKKHAYFVAFNGVAMFGGFGVLRSLSAGISGSIQVMLIVTMLCLIFAIIAGIYSFFPMIVKETKASAKAGPYDNALFFEHIKEHSVDSYISLLCDKYQARPEEILPLDRCIISQIIINARLASRKFAIFKLAAMFDLLAVMPGLGGFILASVL